MKNKKSAGFTLIETLIYIALFTVLMSSAFITAYQLIQGTDVLNAKSVNQEEVNFVLRKINWALTGVETINTPTLSTPYSDTLTVTKYGGNQIDIKLNAGKIELRDGVLGVFLPITTDNVKVTTLQFQYIKPVGIGG